MNKGDFVVLLTIRNVSVAIGGPMLVDEINLQLDEGDRLCLLGRNRRGHVSVCLSFCSSSPRYGLSG